MQNHRMGLMGACAGMIALAGLKYTAMPAAPPAVAAAVETMRVQADNQTPALPPLPALPKPTRTDACEYVGGVPLGGIGTGTVELRGDGSFREWQIFNNWGNSQTVELFKYSPSYDLLNAFAAVKINDNACVLETHPAQGLPGVEKIAYVGWFPFSHLQYGLGDESPVKITAEAFGSYVPHHPDDSGIPAFGLTYRFQNITARPVQISLALSVVNPLGEVCQRETAGGLTVAESVRDGEGGIALAALDGKPVSVMGGADTPETLQSFWDTFRSAQPNYGTNAQGQRVAQVVTFTVPPNASKAERFVVGWYSPDHRENGNGVYVGHKYAAWAQSPADSVRLMAGRFDALRTASANWRDTMRDASWPTWVSHWLCNSQSTLAKNTWWTKDGRFLTYESTECPNGSPVHIIDLADWPVVDEFPALELGLLRQYAANQGPDGHIPEEFQFAGTHPSVTFPGGRDLIDLCPKYAMEVYHRYRETGDRDFLNAVWPSVKKAMLYNRKFDTMGIGLPSGPDISSTWDHWSDRYFFSYGGSVELGGLRAAEELAKVQNDPAFAAQMHTMYETGLASMNNHLWNGEFYAMTTDQALKQNGLSFVESTYGDMMGRFIGLGPILPDDKSLATLRAIAKYNNMPTQWGLVVTADTTGKMVEYDGDVRAQITTCHAIPAPIALMQQGNAEDMDNGLRILKQIYDIGEIHPGGLWNTPHHVVAATGERNVNDFTHYMRDRDVWALLKVLNGWSYDAPDESLALGPILNPQQCRGPWICSTAYGSLAQTITGKRQSVFLKATDGALTLKQIRLLCRTGTVMALNMSQDGRHLKTTFAQDGSRLQVKFLEPLRLQAGSTLEFVVQGSRLFHPAD